MIVVHALGAFALVLSLAGVAYALIAATIVRRWLGSAVAPDGDAVSVSLLKPLFGEEPGLLENLRSFAAQDYGGPIQIVCGVQDPADPALAVARQLSAEVGPVQLDCVADPRLHGPNRKVSNLINMTGSARHDLLILSDADIWAPPDYLRRIVAAMAQPGTGVVSCLYVGQARAGSWSRLAAMGISYGFFPNAALGVRLGLAHPCMGSTIALRRSVLEQIGGFEAFAGSLADDYEIGAAVRAQGLGAVVPPFAVVHGCSERSFGDVFAHELRWAVTIRSIEPWGHLGSIVAHPAPLALIALLLMGQPAWTVAALVLALLARAWLKASVDASVGVASGSWRLLPLRDMLSFGIFVCSLFARSVDWRGTRFHVASDGKLSPA